MFSFNVTLTANEFAFGNDDTGSAIAPEHIITHAITSILAWPSCWPTLATIGRTTMAATVDDIKVPMDKTKIVNAYKYFLFLMRNYSTLMIENTNQHNYPNRIARNKIS